MTSGSTLAHLVIFLAAGASLSVPTSPGTAKLLEDGMVRIPAERFVQGRDGSERPDESPAHAVDVAAFDLDATLVTRRAFADFVDATHYVTSAERLGAGMFSQEGVDDWAWQRLPHASWRRPFRDDNDDTRAFLADDAPVTMVSWDDAVAYCTHFQKRLPTESEWEVAMRAGSRGTRYPWGGDPKVDGRYRLNFWQGASHRENLRSDGFVYVSPVRAFPPNAWGFYDAVGNVWQWTADAYDQNAYGPPHSRAELEPSGAPYPDRARPAEKVLRGGSWWCGACACEGNGLFYLEGKRLRAPRSTTTASAARVR